MKNSNEETDYLKCNVEENIWLNLNEQDYICCIFRYVLVMLWINNRKFSLNVNFMARKHNCFIIAVYISHQIFFLYVGWFVLIGVLP